MKKLLDRFKSKKLEQPLVQMSNYDVVVHIGAPKTGSSAIQKFLLENRDTLAKNGYYYPKHGLDENGISGGHSGLGLSLINDDMQQAKSFFDAYITQAKEKNLTLLLSAESLFNYHAKFYELVHGYDCRVIAFFREPLEALFSNYNQSVKRHFNTSHISKICENALQNKSFGSSGIYKRWIELFGEEHVAILEYDLEYFKKFSIVEVFLSSLGVEQKAIEKIKPKKFEQVNKSYTLAELEFKRVLNHVLDKENKKENFEIDWLLQRLSDAKQENRTLLSELSVDMYEELNENFATTRAKMTEYGMQSYSTPSKTQTKHQQDIYAYKEKVIDILNIVAYIKKENQDLYNYVVSQISQHVKKHSTLSYDVLKLLEWFDMSHEMYQAMKKEHWFSQAQLNNMSAGKYKEPDFLRDIATLLFHRGDIENADKLISRALELRPTGPAIQALKEKIREHK